MNPSHRINARTIAGVCAFVTLGACAESTRPQPTIAVASESTKPMPPAPVELGSADATHVVTLGVGQVFRITLQTIGGGSYGEPEVSSACVRFLGIRSPALQNPGGPRQVFEFQCVSAGEARIRMSHRARDAFSIDISVK